MPAFKFKATMLWYEQWRSWQKQKKLARAKFGLWWWANVVGLAKYIEALQKRCSPKMALAGAVEGLIEDALSVNCSLP